ncbi:MAG: SAM-dependent chlorinase/fluorinase [Bacteroidales bacterium]|nr:SAM-dependent chlorinase/fluorinase [Bacteroidales bacterium]
MGVKVVTLISDWGRGDLGIGIMRGRFLAQCPDCHLIDLTHDVELQSSSQTAFVLEHVYDNFPQGTVHLALTEVSCWSMQPPVITEVDGHFFIGVENGVLAEIFDDRQLAFRRYFGTGNGTLEMMVNLAVACLDGSWQSVTESTEVERVRTFHATYNSRSSHISGHIVYVDQHNNIVTNIPVEMFREAMEAHSGFECSLSTFHIRRFHEHFMQDNQPYFVPNSLGVMEIVTYGGRVRLLARWQQELNIEIDFK